MHVAVWGCIERWRTEDKGEPFSIPEAHVTVEAQMGAGVAALRRYMTGGDLVLKRCLLISINADSVSPIWLSFSEPAEVSSFLRELELALAKFRRMRKVKVVKGGSHGT